MSDIIRGLRYRPKLKTLELKGDREYRQLDEDADKPRTSPFVVPRLRKSRPEQPMIEGVPPLKAERDEQKT